MEQKALVIFVRFSVLLALVSSVFSGSILRSVKEFYIVVLAFAHIVEARTHF